VPIAAKVATTRTQHDTITTVNGDEITSYYNNVIGVDNIM
jgi:hypothetical protein